MLCKWLPVCSKSSFAFFLTFWNFEKYSTHGSIDLQKCDPWIWRAKCIVAGIHLSSLADTAKVSVPM